MRPNLPAETGMHLEAVDTPSLLIELDTFERNIDRMARAVSENGLRLRPHAKTHKCDTIARIQMRAGACGVCCQKVGEAEEMVRGGIRNILVSNQIVGASKVRRLCALARHAAIAVCADHSAQIEAYGREAADLGVDLSVLVEVNVGANRCGVSPGEAAAALAKRILDTPGLSFGGIQAYHGAAQHRRTPAERRAAVESAVRCVTETLESLSRYGISCNNITGAGTGTFRFEAGSGVYTEIQAGSYIFMDADYARNLDENGLPIRDFEQSLFVYATVISRPEPGRAVLDAGLKALSTDSGMPLVEGMPDVTYVGASDEHGKLILNDPGRSLGIGDKLKLIPGHCDPTVNLYDQFVCFRGNRVEAIWSIMPRSAVR